MRMRAGFVTESAFDPLLAAKFSMRTIQSFGRQLRTKRSRGRLDRLANVIDQALHEGRVIAFSHHADQWLSTRFADDKTPTALELGFGRGDAFLDAVGLQRLRAPVEPDVLEKLRKRFELAQEFARRRSPFDQCGKHLQTCDEAVPRGRMVRQDDVPRLLAADVAAALAHLLEHVAVAN